MEEEKEVFVIDSDAKAEWALKKIRAAEEETDRLMALIVHEQMELEKKEKELMDKLEQDTGYLKHLLSEYMQTVKTKSTKTQSTYQLLSGKLVYKFPTMDYKRDEEKLLAWAESSQPELVKVKKSIDWAELKKKLVVTPSGAVATMDGEVIEAIQAEEKPGKFEVKF